MYLRAVPRRIAARLTGRPDPPSVGATRFGSLRRLRPISSQFGYDRGQPIDRYYIERFLADHAPDVRGSVLEIADDTYTRRFGGQRVTRRDVLHVADHGPGVTIVADLSDGREIPDDAYDCIILTQTLQLVYRLQPAIATLHRILRPGGVVLATLPGIGPISRYDMDRWGHYWSFTSRSAQRLFEEAFPTSHVQVGTYGNVLTASSFLYGLASRELRPAELDWHDPDYQLLITVRAVKPGREVPADGSYAGRGGRPNR